MDKWEYRTWKYVMANAWEIAVEISQYGEEGWECIGPIPSKFSHDDEAVLLFKRKKTK